MLNIAAEEAKSILKEQLTDELLRLLVSQPARFLYQLMETVKKRFQFNDADDNFNYVMNLPIYTHMWNKRFSENTLQPRYQDIITKKQEGKERFDLSGFIEKRRLNENTVDKLVEDHESKAVKDNKWVRGMYLNGNHTMTHEESVNFRKGQVDKKEGRG